MKSMPLIGLTCGIDYEKELAYVKNGYFRAIHKCGALAVLIPVDNLFSEKELIHKLDGLLLTGGPDVDPMFFKEEAYTFNGNISPERDKQELALAELAFYAGKPILGICRGAQVLNVAMGGTIFQDIKSQTDTKFLLKHDQQAPKWYPTHNISITIGSKVEKYFNNTSARVNSFHHQAIKDVAPGFAATAVSSDGIIEAIEYTGDKYAVGVQWHPETMWEKDDIHLKVFEDFVVECKKAM